LLSIADLTFLVTTNHTLHIPKFEVKTGEVVALWGPNGCGKSSFVELLAGFHPESPTVRENSILLNGRFLTYYQQHELPVVVVWQDGRIFEHMSPVLNVAFPFSAAGISNIEANQRSLQLLRSLFTEGAFDMLFKRRNSQKLSGGQRQMVAIARAIARVEVILTHSPALLVLDEAFDGLDDESGNRTISYINQLIISKNVGGILVSHDSATRAKISNRSYKINRLCGKNTIDISNFDVIED
jgi:ABC-type sulfate/molybdate transport systems ATPase subunit